MSIFQLNIDAALRFIVDFLISLFSWNQNFITYISKSVVLLYLIVVIDICENFNTFSEME